MGTTTNKAAKKRGSQKIGKQTLKLREQLWPTLDETLLWNRKTATGFTTIPRTMPHIFRIIDDLGGKGIPLSRVYFSLWCRVFDESLIKIQSYAKLAYEAGFSGQRAVTLWKQRMARLVELEFIQAEEGAGGKYDYILLLNPYHIITQHHMAEIQKQKYTELFNRAEEIGATDLN